MSATDTKPQVDDIVRRILWLTTMAAEIQSTKTQDILPSAEIPARSSDSEHRNLMLLSAIALILTRKPADEVAVTLEARTVHEACFLITRKLTADSPTNATDQSARSSRTTTSTHVNWRSAFAVSFDDYVKQICALLNKHPFPDLNNLLLLVHRNCAKKISSRLSVVMDYLFDGSPLRAWEPPADEKFSSTALRISPFISEIVGLGKQKAAITVPYSAKLVKNLWILLLHLVTKQIPPLLTIINDDEAVHSASSLKDETVIELYTCLRALHDTLNCLAPAVASSASLSMTITESLEVTRKRKEELPKFEEEKALDFGEDQDEQIAAKRIPNEPTLQEIQNSELEALEAFPIPLRRDNQVDMEKTHDTPIRNLLLALDTLCGHTIACLNIYSSTQRGLQATARIIDFPSPKPLQVLTSDALTREFEDLQKRWNPSRLGRDLQAEFENTLKEILRSPPSTTYHCEASVMAKSIADGKSDTVVIGTGKKSCPGCATLADVLDKTTSCSFSLPGRHARWFPWVPPAMLGREILEQLEQWILVQVKVLLSEPSPGSKDADATSSKKQLEWNAVIEREEEEVNSRFLTFRLDL